MASDGITTEPGVDFLEHFEELRRRLLICVFVMIAAMIAGWFAYPYGYRLLAEPILASVKAHGGQVFTLYPAEAFFTRMKMSTVAGVALSLPVILWQLWSFIRPGLTPRERRAVGPLVPAIGLLFLLGGLLAYLMMPGIMNFFQSYVPEGVQGNIHFQESINFPLKIIIAFGLGFQLPIVVLGLVWLRVLSAGALLKQWRIALAIIGVLAAVLTPTGDPFNWALMAVPLFVLYFGTVAFAMWTERRERQAAKAAMPEP